MIPAPRRAGTPASGSAGPSIPSPIAPPTSSEWPDIDDDDGWQDMPVVRSDQDDLADPDGSDDSDTDKDRGHHRKSYAAPVRLDPLAGPSSLHGHGYGAASGGVGGGAGGASNATGAHLEMDSDTFTVATDSWRQKNNDLDESDYTRLRLDEDEESDAVHMRTKYLFNEDKAMTPLSQMQATKELLTEGQRIAYVGLCHLVAKTMVRDTGRGWQGAIKKSLKGKEKAVPAQEDAGIWMIKIMARLYQHMELEPAEQKMIESLAEHGVDPSDLVPALMATHTVKNPEYDPVAKKQADMGIIPDIAEYPDVSEVEHEAPPPPYRPRSPVPQEQAAEIPLPPSKSTTPRPPSPSPTSPSRVATETRRDRPVNPFGDDDEEEAGLMDEMEKTPRAAQPIRVESEDDGDIGGALPPPVLDQLSIEVEQIPPEDDGGHIGAALAEPPASKISGEAQARHKGAAPAIAEKAPEAGDIGALSSPGPSETSEIKESSPAEKLAGEDRKEDKVEAPEATEEEKPELLPSLPGVSTSLTNLDEHVTLDIRWTVLCDLFLVLIADSVYDARSRTYLQLIAEALGFEWLDTVRFENRITDALEIEEAVGRNEQGEVIEGRRKKVRNKRYAMMGLAAVGGGLVIGLSAGLLAPVIGAGLGAAFATVGITGTSGFLGGAAGAAVITTTGVVTGANIGGKGMWRRTREVRTFEFRPLHNNKRVACYITMGGFMASKMDDVRLPFSVLDPIIGDVISVHWEPEMMEETGGALKILTSEVLTSVGQQVLAATVMAALISALQWPILLTKLGYLIDNPWSNALDRSYAAGLVLADVILQRHAGVRPVSLIGFSLGARSIFYALVELARQKAFGLVQDVFIFGTTVTANRTQWLEARSVVSGRFVNGFASNDWMLGYLFRATSGGINTVAGLRPVETVPGMENVDVTDIITGHMSYRSMMPQLLARVGLPVTSDHFDEPEDPNVDMSQQERIIVNEEEEEAKRNKSKILGIFSRANKSKNPSGASTPVERKSTSASASKRASYDAGEEDDDLPPRESQSPREAGPEGAAGDLGMGISAPSTESLAQARAAQKAEEEAIKHIPKTAGFDFAAISKVLGKEIDVDKIKVDTRPQVSPVHVDMDRSIERSASVPPQLNVMPPADELPRVNLNKEDVGEMGRSSSYTARVPRPISTEDDEGDITFGADTSASDVWGRKPSPPIYAQTQAGSGSSVWGRSSPGSASPLSPPATASPFSAIGGGFGFNAWAGSSSASSSSMNSNTITNTSSGLRAAPPARPHPPELSGIQGGFAAPPARPHPPELMANPFASAPTTSSKLNGANGAVSASSAADRQDNGMWGWGKRQKSLEDEAMNNPW